ADLDAAQRFYTAVLSLPVRKCAPQSSHPCPRAWVSLFEVAVSEGIGRWDQPGTVSGQAAPAADTRGPFGEGKARTILHHAAVKQRLAEAPVPGISLNT